VLGSTNNPSQAGYDALGQLIPHRAAGGPVDAGQVALVGERGPELVRFGASGYVTPNAMLTAANDNTGRSLLRDLAASMHDLNDNLREFREKLIGAAASNGGPGWAMQITQGIREIASGPAGTFSGSGRERINSWMTFLMSKMGLPQWKAAEVTAGMQGESGINLAPGQQYWDVNGPSGGTAAWHNERLQGLKNFAAAMGKSWQDVEVQQAWFKREMETTHQAAWHAIQAAQSRGQALSAFVQKYEVPANADLEIAKRSAFIAGNMRGAFTPLPIPEQAKVAPLPVPQLEGTFPRMPQVQAPVQAAAPQLRPAEATLRGSGEVRVILTQEGRIKDIQAKSDGHVRLNVGLDRTGDRVFQPAPVVRGAA
jgi:hypothetical protein